MVWVSAKVRNLGEEKDAHGRPPAAMLAMIHHQTLPSSPKSDRPQTVSCGLTGCLPMIMLSPSSSTSRIRVAPNTDSPPFVVSVEGPPGAEPDPSSQLPTRSCRAPFLAIERSGSDAIFSGPFNPPSPAPRPADLRWNPSMPNTYSSTAATAITAIAIAAPMAPAAAGDKLRSWCFAELDPPVDDDLPAEQKTLTASHVVHHAGTLLIENSRIPDTKSLYLMRVSEFPWLNRGYS